MKNAPKHLIFTLLIILIASFTTATAVHADGLCVDSGDLACPPLIPAASDAAIAADPVYAAAWVDAFQAGGDRLTALQNNDGGWDWPLDDGNPANASPKNTVGPIAMGLAQAYLETADAAHLAALQDAGTFLLAKTNNFSPSDGYLAAQLDAIFGGTTYVDHVIANFYGPLAAGTYNRNGAGTLLTTADYVDLIRTSRASQGIANLAAWDIGMGLVAAASAGADTSDWIAGVKAEIDELNGDGTEFYDVIGLTGAVYGLAFVGEDYDPTAGEHAAASSLADLAAILAGYQLSTGGFTWTATQMAPNSDEVVQETAYAVLALQEFNATTYFDVIQDAAAYIRSVQLGTGGWEGNPGSGENNEITGEALWAITYETVPPLGALNGSAEIVSNNSEPIVAISRPHMGSEVMAYNSTHTGGATVNLPMLFNNKWGYTSTFTVQNIGTGLVNYDLTFKDADTGADSCVISGESLPLHGVLTYDVTDLGACDSGSLPNPWYGSVVVASDDKVAAVATLVIEGSAVTYNSFTYGNSTNYLPMLFKEKWDYNAAFYVQNIDDTGPSTLDIEFYDNQGNYTCTYHDTTPIVAGASRGYWMGTINNVNCDPGLDGTGFLAGGWAGSAVIYAYGADNLVAIGRPHMGTEVAAYNGSQSGSTTSYLPMLFRGMWGYDSAMYVQNVNSGDKISVEITFYDTDGNEVCIYDDPEDIDENATRGYWLPTLNCTDGRNFSPAGWAGSAKIVTNYDATAVGRAHLGGGEVVAYPSFSSGYDNAYLPFNFRTWSGNETALYIQNLGGVDADVSITFFDEEDGFYCEMDQVVAPGSSGAIWLASLTEATCYPLP